LGDKIIGQPNAIDAVVRAVKRSKVGLKDPKRPAGSFMFLGPTGVGKSELAKLLAEYLFGDRDALIRIDMSEFMEKHTVSRLIGSPPGYVGFNEGGQLTEPIRRKPYSVVLFDELEKASSDVTNILLQILEDGRLTDSTGRTVSFRNAIIVMTSNVGSKYIQQETSFGFVEATNQEESKVQRMKLKLEDELKREFKPEFLNRIDDIVIFKSLVKEDANVIVDIMLDEVKERLEESGISISYDNKINDFLVEKGFDQKQGARPLRRAIQLYFEDKLADTLLSKEVHSDVNAKATVKKDLIVFTVTKKPARKKKKPSKKDPVLVGSQ